MEGLALAHRAAAGPGQAFPFIEYEPTFGALGRLDDETPAGPVKGLADVLEMAGDLLLRDPHPAGQVHGRERAVLQFRYDRAADSIVCLCRRTRAIQVCSMTFAHIDSILQLAS
jgi:hypothetical protein